MTLAGRTDHADSKASRSPWAYFACPRAAWLVLAAFYLFLLAAAHDKSATVDEFRHATAGYSYWKFNDYRLDPENGNWSKRWTALALLAGSNSFPDRASDEWTYGLTAEVADAWFNHGEHGLAMLQRGRAASGLMAVALGFLVWLWARRLFGPEGGMLSLLLYVCSPIVLANGALMTSDMPVACFFLAALWCFDAMLRRLTAWNILLSACAIAGLFLAKMSGPIIVPILLVQAIARLIAPDPIRIHGSKALATVRAKFAGLAIAALIHVAVIWALIWGSYGFRYSAFAGAPGHFVKPWEWVLDLPTPPAMLNQIGLSEDQVRRISGFLVEHGISDGSWSNAAESALQAFANDGLLTRAQAGALARMRAAHPKPFPLWLISVARQNRLLPEAYLYGYANVLRMAPLRGSFLNGRFSPGGFRTFFPYVFAVKTPLATLAVVSAAFAALVLGPAFFRPRGVVDNSAGQLTFGATLPLWGFVIVYFAVAVASTVNIGHRHLLPIYPPLFVLGGAVINWIRCGMPAPGGQPWIARHGSGALVGALFAVIAVEALAWFPNYLAYFNGVVPPVRAYRHLVDSSLDWGQDLPAAKRYTDAHPELGPFFLIYFGADNPRRYGLNARELYRYPEIEGHATPLLRVLRDIPPEEKAVRLQRFFLENPEYDPSFVARLDGSPPSFVAVKHASALRWEPGTYIISASLVQPLFYLRTHGRWGREEEANYQSLRERVRPLLAGGAARSAALSEQGMQVWQQLYREFEEFRFARLAACLRRREPNATINYSLLVYRLSAAELEEAEAGPPPLDT